MTMNTRQAGAFTELIRKEEQARERWNATHGQNYPNTRTQGGAQNGQNGSATQRLAVTGQSFGGPTARPWSARGYGATQVNNNLGQTQSSAEFYRDAISVSSPRPVDPADPQFSRPQTVTKRVVREVEVPVTRQVKVPIRTTQIVEVMVPRQVRSKKVIEVDAYTERDQQRIPVKKYREVDDYVTVQVPEQRAIEVDGVRIDEVKETKLVEVEEFHQYQLVPRPTGQGEVVATRDLGLTGRRLDGRRTGRDVFQSNDPYVANLPQDDYGRSSARSGYYSSRPQSAAPRYTATQNGSYGFNGTQSGFQNTQQVQQRLGFKVRTSTSAPGTCAVFEVEPGQLAARSGLKTSDVILSVNGRPSNSLQDFKNAVQGSRGPLLLQVKRGVDRFVVTLQR